MPVQIGAQTISGGAQTGTAQALSQWSSQRREEKARKNLEAARREGLETDILENDEGKKMLPEQRQAKFGFFGSKTAEQYNKGVRDAYVLSIDNDNTTEINRIAQEADGNLGKFEEVASQYSSTVLANVDPLASNDIKMSLDKMVFRARNQVQRLGVERQIRQDKETRQIASQNYFDEASRLTRNGDFEGGQENILKSKAALDSMVESGDLSAEKANSIFTSGKKEVYRQAHKKSILDVAEDDVDLAEQNLNKLEKDIPKDFTPDEWESVIDDIRADVNRVRTKVKAGASASLSKTRADLKDYKESVELGFKINETERNDIAQAVAGTELQEEFSRVNKLEQFSVMPAKKRDVIVEQLSAATTLSQQQDYIAAKKANEKLKAMAKADGIALGVRQGLIDQSPLNIGDDASMAQRIKDTEMLSSIYGVNVPFFQDTEAQAFVDGLAVASIKEKVSFAKVLGGVPNAWEQIADKNAGVFAMAGAIGDDSIMTAIFNGQELLKTKQVNAPSLKDYESILEDKIGNSGEIYGPKDRSDTITAAIAHYAATTGSPVVFDSSAFEKSIDAITGGTDKINGFKVELPRGVSANALEEFLTEIEPETLEMFGGSVYPIEQVRNAQFKSIGNNTYRVMVNGLPALTNNGSFLEIQYSDRSTEVNDASRLAKQKKANQEKKEKRDRSAAFYGYEASEPMYKGKTLSQIKAEKNAIPK